MAGIDDTINSGVNINVNASGGQSVQQLAAQLANLNEQIGGVTKKLKDQGAPAGDVLTKTAALKNESALAGAALGRMQEAVQLGIKNEKLFASQTAEVTQHLKAAKAAIDAVTTAEREENAAATQAAANKKAAINDWNVYVATMKQTAAAVKNQIDAERAWVNSQKKAGDGTKALANELKGLVLQYIGIAAAINFVKTSFESAMHFDEQLDKIAVSSSRMGVSFKDAGEKLHALALNTSKTAGYDINGVGGNQSIFDESQILTGLEKFRDRGFDVFHMTQEQLKPVLDAAVATVQDLGQVSDATAIALQQFGMSIEETGTVADVMVSAFKESGLTAEEFATSVSAAGAAARASGTDLAEYTAVLVRLKQLGIENGAQFQKLFFAAINAPSAQQLKAFSDAGVSPYVSSSSYGKASDLAATSDIGNAAKMAENLGFDRIADSLQKARLGAAQFFEQFNRPAAEMAANVERAVQELVDLQAALEKVDGQTTVYTTLVTSLKGEIDGLKVSQAEWKTKLDETTKSLTDVTKQIDGLTSIALPGMHEMDVAIEQSDLRAKAFQLQMLQNAESTRAFERSIRDLNDQVHDQERATERMRRSYEDVGAALEKAKGKASGLEAALQKLRNPELAGESAFDDKAFGIKQQIDALNLRKSKLSPIDLFGANQIDAQVAALQKQLEQTNLERSLQFDPQKRAIEQAAHASDIRTGKATGPTTEADAISRIDRLTDQYLKQEKRVKSLTREHDLEARAIRDAGDATQALKDRVDEVTDAMDRAKRATQDQTDALKDLQDATTKLKLEEAVKYGPDQLRIKEAQYRAKQAVGLTPQEQSADSIIGSIPALVQQYKDLAKERDFDRAQVMKYDDQIRSSEAVLKIYQSRLDDSKVHHEQLTDEIKRQEEQFARMPKAYKSEIDILDELSGHVLNAGLAYDMLGKRGGGALVALIGQNGENAGKLQELADVMGSQGGAASSASEASSSLFDEAQAVRAAFHNLQIEVGTGLADSMAGLTGAIITLTNAILGSKDIPKNITEHTPIGGLASGAGKASVGDWGGAGKDFGLVLLDPFNLRSVFGLASGGIVPGRGSRDTVPAMLTPGEEVLRRDDPRHRANGGGVTVILNGDVHVNREQDMDRLVDKIDRKLAERFTNRRYGMAA